MFCEELFPSAATESVLQFSDTFVVSEFENVSEDAVVRDTQLPPFIAIRDVKDFNPICDNGHWANNEIPTDGVLQAHLHCRQCG